MRRFEANTCLASLGIILLSSSGAVAQPLGSEVSSPVEDKSSNDDIVVTAQRRSERLVDVPISVTAVNGASLRQAGVSDVQSLSQVVPAFRMDSQAQFFQPTIRGVTSTIAGPGLSANVATYVDGFYQPSPFATNFELPDVDSVQVLKGPQGTLFGRNSTGGAITIDTLAPSFTPHGEVRASYGNYRELRGSLYLTGPITDTLAASVTAYGRDENSFIRNIVTNERVRDTRSYVLRGKLLWAPRDGIEITASAFRGYVSDATANAVNAYKGQTTAALFPGAIIATKRGQVSNDAPDVSIVRQSGQFLTGKFNLGGVTLTSRTSHQKSSNPPSQSLDADATNFPLLAVYNWYTDETVTQEFLLNSAPGARFQWVAGAFYMHENGQLPHFSASFGGAPYTEFFGSKLIVDSAAVYADGTYQVSDKIYATLGARASVDYLKMGYTGFIPGLPSSLSAKTHFKRIDPRAVLRYNISHSSNVYASVTRGSKSGVFNAAGGTTDSVKPEVITAYEVGFKYSSPKIKLEVAGFHYDYQDLQVSTYEVTTPILLNAAKAQIDGAEAHVSYRVLDDVSVDLGGAYIDGKYKSFPSAPNYTFDPSLGVIVGTVDASGNRISRAPKWSGNVGISYTPELPDGSSLQLAANASFQSKIYFDAVETTNQPGYATINLRGGWTSRDGKWSIAAYGRNITDKKYLTSVIALATALESLYGRPATYGIEATLKF